MRTIDVYILTGFLGAGKTTALNAILSGDMASIDPALIINEFGSIGVDGALVERQDLTRYEINKGSIFCICTKTDFLKSLTEIAERQQHRTVLIEATGIAETADIESLIEMGPLRGIYRVKGNICLVDAANFTQVAAYLKSALTQVRCADAIVLNKIDLAEEKEIYRLQTILAELNPRARQIRTQYGRMPSDFLREIVHQPAAQIAFEQPPVDIVAVSIGGTQIFQRDAFFTAIAVLKPNLLRLKGHVRFRDGLRFVELSGEQLNENNPANGYKGDSAFTAIAWKVDKEVVRNSFMSCTAAQL